MENILKINSDRLWKSLMDIAQIGPGVAGGNNRQALTDEDAEGRSLFQQWSEEAGLVMGVDSMGSMFMTRLGTDPDALPVYIGSHLDTQNTGGKFDGILGVLAGLELVRTLNDANIKTTRSIVLVNWANEEGARFSPPMLASGVFAGIHSLEYAHACVDHEGLSYGAELERIGWRGDEKVGARKIHSYFEYHIEQGPILEAKQKEIGVVTHCQGLMWLQFTLKGKSAHTGSTPMNMRINTPLAMANIIKAVEEITMQSQPDALGAIGHVTFSPNSRNVMPEEVIFTVDIRSKELSKLKLLSDEIKQRAQTICANLQVKCDIELVANFNPVTFDSKLVNKVRNATTKLGYSHMDIVSGAGHDACWIAKVAPTTMIMCPCVGGISHNEAEDISPEWAASGANVLLHAVLETAKIQK